MGMFDSIECAYPLPDLPDPIAAGVHFQTKDLENTMDTYDITAAGRLVLRYREWEATPTAELPYPDRPYIGCIRVKAGSERPVDTNYHGILNFYGSKSTGELRAINLQTGVDSLHPEPEEDYEYVAKFTDGTLVSVERVGDAIEAGRKA